MLVRLPRLGRGRCSVLPNVFLLIMLWTILSIRVDAQTDANSRTGATGNLTGLISDQATSQPLAGANVIIEGTGFGAATLARKELLS